ncbi:SDR family NAD(P)-dependent oxidoreductase, partial [Aquimarina litoralis]|uniref:SDR family NAD(P)-dependent oxidoreductase n=1 Tax=Aquimarina litoralis TaxID=584605 RepID=UPI001C5733C6
MQVKNKIVVVTGAGSGIGAATAKHFAKYEATVVVSDIKEGKAKRIADQIIEEGGKAVVIPANVANYEEVASLISNTVDQFGRLDVMVNNAGIGPRNMSKTAEYTLQDWDSVIAVNQTGVFYCMKLALQQMMKQGHGNIVNIASLAGLKASLNNLSYSASKFAV